jgi:FMN phosphatase YigB (HAD superfamily)
VTRDPLGGQRSPIQAVLFDFHHTLFDVEAGVDWIHSAAERIGRTISDQHARALLDEIEAARADPDVMREQQGRDRSEPAHRTATMFWLRTAGVDRHLAAALYGRLRDPGGWFPYRDSAFVLSELAGRGVPVGVVSNTGWDVREAFVHHGLADHVQSFTLSCEHGIEKPEPDLFRIACEELGIRPSETLVVGDNPLTDGGAVTAGMPVYLLPAGLPGDTRGLRVVLRLVPAAVAQGPVAAYRHKPAPSPSRPGRRRTKPC